MQTECDGGSAACCCTRTLISTSTTSIGFKSSDKGKSAHHRVKKPQALAASSTSPMHPSCCICNSCNTHRDAAPPSLCCLPGAGFKLPATTAFDWFRRRSPRGSSSTHSSRCSLSSAAIAAKPASPATPLSPAAAGPLPEVAEAMMTACSKAQAGAGAGAGLCPPHPPQCYGTIITSSSSNICNTCNTITNLSDNVGETIGQQMDVSHDS